MKLIIAAALVCFRTLAGPLTGDSLTFRGLQDGEQVLEYYNGGLGGLGSGPGPQFGVSFTSGLAEDPTVIAEEASALVTAASVTMNLADPWSGLVSFYFAGDGTVAFYSEQDASGDLLASFALSNPPAFGFPFGTELGPFRSVAFTPTAGSELRLDTITFGGLVIPEPSCASSLSCGIVLIGIIMLMRKRYWQA